MKKTATRQEVERVLEKEYGLLTKESKDKILNELFGEPYEPKVGDCVITKGYHPDYDGRVLEITRVSNKLFYYFKVLDGGYFLDNVSFTRRHIERPATEEEIKRAQWKEGEVYEVWDDGDVKRYFEASSKEFGTFGESSEKWDNFKRIVQC